jgi:hypothetical protein
MLLQQGQASIRGSQNTWACIFFNVGVHLYLARPRISQKRLHH